MRRMAGYAFACLSLTVAACGGSKHQPPPQEPPPVAEQVREALLNALGSAALSHLTPGQRPKLPYSYVTACSGPGGPGRYRCHTTPQGHDGLRSVDVDVKANGQWSTKPLTVELTTHGHRGRAVTGVWGVGIRFRST
jgi:hypothetical protein